MKVWKNWVLNGYFFIVFLVRFVMMYFCVVRKNIIVGVRVVEIKVSVWFYFVVYFL